MAYPQHLFTGRIQMCCEVLEVTFRLWKYKNLVLYIYIYVYLYVYIYIYTYICGCVETWNPRISWCIIIFHHEIKLQFGYATFFSDKHMLAFEWENIGKMIIFKTRHTRFTSCYIHFTIHSFQISRKQEQS